MEIARHEQANRGPNARKSRRHSVKVGEEVLEYQEVLILEAMKMENAIPSPESGKVKEIKVKKDDTVASHQVLMVLE